MATSGTFTGDVSIVLGGEAGQGIQTIEAVLDSILAGAGYHVFSTSEFMSRIRGGSNSTEIRISAQPCSAYVDRMDIFIPLDTDAIPHLSRRISKKTVIMADRSRVVTEHEIIDIPISKMAAEVGGKLFENTVAAGILLGLLDIEIARIESFLARFFAKKSADLIQKNIEAARRGHTTGKELASSGTVRIDIPRSQHEMSPLLLSGVDAVSMGAIAGGCNFVGSYPMSPGTGVLTFLAQQARRFGIVVEQAEDEIAAMNMAIGAWYAGGRGMVTTSGGGFALMTEGLSLSGMLETPVVIHLGQRPGPATGLPTRTEQGDLNLALYAGHGDFPRIIFAPGNLDEAFTLTRKAFNLADKYQAPVFILTDQFLLDSNFMARPFDIASTRIERHIVKTAKDYKRYALTPSGVSPRGIPGYGDGIVAVDSDEHTEEGYITEETDVRVSMVDKRLRKAKLIAKETVAPRFEGGKSYDTIVVCWGSTCDTVREALARVGSRKTALLHFSQVWPLPRSARRYFEKARHTIVVENNATSQFGNLIRQYYDVEPDTRILKYDGHQFSVEEVVSKIKKAIH